MNLLLPQNIAFESSSLVIGVLNGLAGGYLASLFLKQDSAASTLLAFLIRRRSGFVLWLCGFLGAHTRKFKLLRQPTVQIRTPSL